MGCGCIAYYLAHFWLGSESCQKGLMTLEYLLTNQITVILFSFNVCNIGGNLNANTQKTILCILTT